MKLYNKPILLFLIIQCLIPIVLYSQAEDLRLKAGDTYIEISPNENGFHLWIRNKPGLSSILLTESSADPEKRFHSYTLRSYEYNPINGDERRILNGEFLEPKEPLYFLLDSSPEAVSYFPEGGFHVFIPYNVTYGYPYTRQGQLEIGRGSWINVRAFAKPYADYSGGYVDNPFVLNIEELPELDNEPLLAEKDFSEIGERTNGDFAVVGSASDAGENIKEYLSSLTGDELDLVFVIDTTVSMQAFLDYVKEHLVNILEDDLNKFVNYRVGFVFYRDYKEEYLTKNIGYRYKPRDINNGIQNITVAGGQDLEEAVYEGLYAGLKDFDWVAEEKLIILVGDAPPHTVPKGDITSEDVYRLAEKEGVKVYSLLLVTKDDGDIAVKESEVVKSFDNVLRDEE